MWFNLQRVAVESGNHAEVIGVTTRGWRNHKQQGSLKITRPGQRTRIIRLGSAGVVRQAYEFADRYNAACGSSTAWHG